MRNLYISEWIKRALHRKAENDRKTKVIYDLQRQLSYALYLKGKLERTLNAITQDPEGASAEVWQQKYLSAMTFIYATRSIDAFQQHLKLTEGHDYSEDLKQ